MPDISKHLFIMIYIMGFLLGIIQLTLNQIYISKTRDVCYKKLQFYNWAFFGHIAINFIYFYGLYFYISWDVKDFILFLVNSCFVIYLFSAVQMMQSFGGYRITYSKILIAVAGSFYTIAYSLSYKVMASEVRDIPTNLALAISVLSEILLAGTILFYCAKLVINWAGNRNVGDYGLLIPVFSIGTVAYMLFNTYVDVCFYFFEDKTVIWGINIYNLSVLYYIILNLVAIPLVYKRKTFLNRLLGTSDSSSSSDNAVVEFQTSTILDSVEKYHLSAREIEVLNLIYRGKSNPDISSTLFISNNTVKHHVNSIFKKTGVKNRYELLSIIKKRISFLVGTIFKLDQEMALWCHLLF